MIPIDLHTLLFWAVALVTGGCAIAVVVTQNIVRAAVWLLFTLAGTAGIFFLLGADFVGATQIIVYVGGTLVLVVFGVMLTAQGPFITMRTSPVEWGVGTVVGLLLLGVLVVTSGKLEPIRFKLDAKSFASLQAQKVPEEVLVKLRPLQDEQVFKTKKQLRSDLKSILTPDEQDRFQNLVLDHAHQPISADPAATHNSVVLGEALLGVKEASPEGVLTGLPEGKEKEAPARTRLAYLLPFEIVSVHLLVVLIGAAYLARAKRRRGTS